MSELYGLVLTGGASTRMRKDKASLKFHGKAQAAYCYELLGKFCSKVFISNRKEQKNSPGQKRFPQIHDQAPYLNIGPLGGILSAMTKFPNVDWLVLACDLPFVNEETIHYLIVHRNSKKTATAFISTYDNLPEPLCTIYERHARELMIDHLNSAKTCPRKFLINADVELINQMNPQSLDNINNPQEYKEALKNVRK